MRGRTLFERMSDASRGRRAIAEDRALMAAQAAGELPREHDFPPGLFGPCRGCGKHVEELIDDRYCSGSKCAEFDEGGEA